jgi:benzoyl-CoA reductase/2-hydroxyglutaryl-CoA dehydratase subunit BcrC/BadD/HgdB
MWSNLGLDLERHDALLAGLSAMYQDMFLTQQERPEGMAYFDSVVAGLHGDRVAELLDFKARGGKVVGLYCVFVPEDLALAAGAVPIGLCAGAQFAVPDAEEVLPRNSCPLVKSSFGFKVNRTCPFVQLSDFLVGETTCDGKKKMYELLADLHPIHVMEVPQKKTAFGRALFLDELGSFRRRLEEETGREVTASGLAAATAIIDDKRRALKRLHSLRKARPAPISGLDSLLITQIAFYDDNVRITQKINVLCDELDARVAAGEGVAPANAPRILVSGSPMAVPNWKLPHLLELSGAVVVGEESCTGTRYFDKLTPSHDGTLDGQLAAIADRQLDVHCACFTPNNERLDDIVELAHHWSADGVVHYSLQFCHTFANEAVKVERRLGEEGIPLLRIETDYSDEDVGRLQTRIDAFLEMLRR